MKNISSKTKIAVVILFITVILLVGYVYMIARPISYGMAYHNSVVYEGETFEGTIRYYPDGTLSNKNSNFDEEMTEYYYYKDGYVFTLMAETDEEYEAEVAYINENFDDAVASPFYATRINAFKQVAEGLDEYVTTYTCTGAITFAVVGGIVNLALIALTVFFFLFKKAKSND